MTFNQRMQAATLITLMAAMVGCVAPSDTDETLSMETSAETQAPREHVSIKTIFEPTVRTQMTPKGAAYPRDVKAVDVGERQWERTLLTQLDLRSVMQEDDIVPVGITVEPETGRRLILDAERGIYVLNADKTLTQIWDSSRAAEYGVTLRSQFTDLVAIEPGVIALTALSDGFLLDLEADTLTQHFCYEPGDEQIWEEMLQITRAVTYDPLTNKIIAQPQTVFAGDLNSSNASFLAWYDRDSGSDEVWQELFDFTYRAGGMALQGSNHLLMGAGSMVDTYTISESALESTVDLARWDITNIQGMAIDSNTQTLLVLDADNDTLSELKLSRLLD